MSAPGRLRELRLLFACAWDEVLDAADAINRWWRRAWCDLVGHDFSEKRLAGRICRRCRLFRPGAEGSVPSGYEKGFHGGDR